MSRILSSPRPILLPVAGIALVALLGWQAIAARVLPSQHSEPVATAGSAPTYVIADGRVVAYPDSDVSVSTEVGGTISRMFVHEGDHVSRGQVLAELRADDFRAAHDEARAKVHEADADIRLYEAEAGRARNLWTERIGSKQALDEALRNIDAARARRQTALASARRIGAELAKRTIVSPIAGTVVSRPPAVGDTVDAGNLIARIADLDRLRIQAEVDEFDSGRIQQGAAVAISADGYPGISWNGVVEEIPDSVSRRQLRPEDPGKLSDTRVLLVKIAFREPNPLRLGERVSLRIATKHDIR